MSCALRCRCCGSAGTYNLTQPEMADRLLARKLDRIEQTTADLVAAGNPGCLLQISGGAIGRRLPTGVIHPIDLLAHAHGIAKDPVIAGISGDG